MHFIFTLALFKHHSAAFSCVWSRFRSNMVEPKLFPLSFLDNQLQMLLVAVGRVSCWIIKHLLAIFTKFVSLQANILPTGFKTHLTSKSHCLAKLGELCSIWLSLTPILPHFFYCSYVETGAGPLKFTDTMPSPHLLRFLWKPKAKKERERGWVHELSFRPSAFFPVVTLSVFQDLGWRPPFIHRTACM